jgi:tetratricopeptide (TPR) repeat protein
MPALREPLAVRWEALRLSKRAAEAAQLRELCLRFWPERISVWEQAGNHALDEAQAVDAQRYFERALELDPTSRIAMAGKAVAREMQKDWEGALVLRREVADQEGAWTKDDAVSLHRVLRVAANLGRLGRWAEAGPHFVRSVARGAFAKIPPERPTLLRVFSAELYAPALIVGMLAKHPPTEQPAPVIQFALQDALALEAIAKAIQSSESDDYTKMLSLGMCAWQAGNAKLAYDCFDKADELREEQMVASYLLMAAAIEWGADELPSIRKFTLELASATLDSTDAGAAERFYATLARVRCGEQQAAALPELAASDLPSGTPVERQLHAWTARRERAVASGTPPGMPGHENARERLRARGVLK